jgi:hypothetical protein
MALFDTLGFQWNRDSVPREVPRASLERVVFRFHRMLPEYVWDAGVLEGNPFTFPEVKTLLEGVTVGGRKLSDQEQILNLAESSKRLIELVRHREFKLEKSTFCSLHALVARNEALEWGHFRGEGYETQFTPDGALGERGRFTPLATEPGAVRLNEVFANGIRSLKQNVSNPFERATAFFLFGSLQQFFFDGNKRTSRFMMNGVLMTEGVDAVSIPGCPSCGIQLADGQFLCESGRHRDDGVRVGLPSRNLADPPTQSWAFRRQGLTRHQVLQSRRFDGANESRAVRRSARTRKKPTQNLTPASISIRSTRDRPHRRLC